MSEGLTWKLALAFDLLTQYSAAPLSIAEPGAAVRSLAKLGASRQDVNLLAWCVTFLGRHVESSKLRRGQPPDDRRL